MNKATLTVIVDPSGKELGVITDQYSEGTETVYVVNDDWEVASRFVSDEGDYVVCFAAF